MLTANVSGKIWSFEKKNTNGGKEYIAITVCSSSKDANGEWKNDYYHLSCWSSAKNYNDTWNLLCSIKAGKPIKDATKVNAVCIPFIEENYKTHEKELALRFLRLEIAEGSAIPAAKYEYNDSVAPAEKTTDVDMDTPF